MNREIGNWLRKVGFEEDRGYYRVWQYRTTPLRLSSEREASFCFELSEESESSFSMCVTMEVQGTKPENYSSNTIWLFTERSQFVKELFTRCVAQLSNGWMSFAREQLDSVMKNLPPMTD